METTNYKLTLAYDGTRYDGWQKQGNTSNTIQGKLETLLTRLDGREVEVHGAGRTDAGVHASGQVCHCRLSKAYAPESLQEVVNQYLPEDIAVVQVEKVSERFHARLWSVGKTYCYRIRTSPIPNVFQRKYVYQYCQPLDVEAIRNAAGYLTGTHDFKSFCSNRHMKKATVRTLYAIEAVEQDGELCIYFHGEGFLYNMVRILTGTLIEVGEGRRTPESMTEILEAENRQEAGMTAPPQGLTLCRVYYSEEEMRKSCTGYEKTEHGKP